MSPARWAVGLARVRFDFDRQNARGVELHRGASPRHTLDRLRAVAHRTSTPPGGRDSRIVEEVVHREDTGAGVGELRQRL
ncbi:hypothetical protein FNH13_02070 [Ornithinimicrobium ciconiae]|uniref:Uncharacterized protein n=1 Tax=Ornithinimicrobium ciconiae TaxID=2594265 RepID=A0A516G6V6_9MICO|nr:hypothetical protein [Ornithinimicrobium ciconiae]QDO87266.1 hypothetical protein FNH13_02070 [Ornithinimicrobium ciconiae]